MRRVSETVSLWCALAGHNVKECRKRLNKKPIRTAAEEMQLKQPVGKTRSKEQTKQKLSVVISKQLDPNRVFVKVNGHPALALLDLQTIAADIIRAQFVVLYDLPVVKIEAKAQATAIKGSQGTVAKTCEVELNWRGYQETRMFYVAHSCAWDRIHGKPALQDVRATISAGTTPVTIQLPCRYRSSLRMC